MLSQGAVVLAVLLDPNGRNPKRRPAVVITATTDILEYGNDEIHVAGITTKFDPSNLQADEVIVPYSRSGNARTGLTEKSVVKCDWLKTVSCSDVQVIGHLPGEHLYQVIQRVNSLDDD